MVTVHNRTTSWMRFKLNAAWLHLCAHRFVKFQNVSSLTVFVEDNQGGEATSVIQRLRFIGQTQAATNMSEFKRVLLSFQLLPLLCLAKAHLLLFPAGMAQGRWRKG